MSASEFMERGEFHRGWHIIPETEGTLENGVVAFKSPNNILFADTLEEAKGIIDEAALTGASAKEGEV